MTLLAVSSTDIALAIAGALALAGYVAFIVAPACACYGRLWEKAAAAFLTIFILMGLVATGAAIGAAVVWSYDRWA